MENYTSTPQKQLHASQEIIKHLYTSSFLNVIRYEFWKQYNYFSSWLLQILKTLYPMSIIYILSDRKIYKSSGSLVYTGSVHWYMEFKNRPTRKSVFIRKNLGICKLRTGRVNSAANCNLLTLELVTCNELFNHQPCLTLYQHTSSSGTLGNPRFLRPA